MDREQSVQHFLDLLKKSRRGNFKIYIGMIAGVGKSYRTVSILKLSSLTNWLIPMSKAVRTKSVGRMSWIYWMPVSV